jgi:hypothetical protein
LVLRWTTLEMVPGVGGVRRWLYLAAMALGVGLAKRCPILSLQWAVAPFPGDVKPWAWIFVAVLTVWVHAVPVLEAPRHDYQEPRHVPSRVTRVGHNRRPSVP